MAETSGRATHAVPSVPASQTAEFAVLSFEQLAVPQTQLSPYSQDALDRDGRGMFNCVTTNDGKSERRVRSGDRQEVQLKTHGGATDYTRRGVWRVRTDRYAARDAWTNFNVGDTHGNEPGSFAYS